VRRLAGFIRLPLRKKLLLVEAVFALSLASVLLKTVAFARLARHIGRHMAESPSAQTAHAERQASRVRWAVNLAADHLPWKPVCFPRAVAATAMLKRRHIASTLYFGVDPAHGLDAHAWVRVGGLIVSGAPVEPRFTVVSTFA
jgi:Transglutaminase-like superfamily